jgi:hypothetical protein
VRQGFFGRCPDLSAPPAQRKQRRRARGGRAFQGLPLLADHCGNRLALEVAAILLYP